jgi:hypothetical protein
MLQAQGEGHACAAAVSEARGRMHLVRATAWRRHGCMSLAAAEAAAFISCHAGDPDDAMHAYAILALIANDRAGPPLHFSHCAEPLLSALGSSPTLGLLS